jgi:hypothetical protein
MREKRCAGLLLAFALAGAGAAGEDWTRSRPGDTETRAFELAPQSQGRGRTAPPPNRAPPRSTAPARETETVRD